MKSLLFSAAVLLSSLAFAETPPPNVVFIIADDLGWSDVGFHGGSAPTPNLDRLARENLELTAHYVAPVCSPTRAALLTGRCWSRFGVVNPQNELALPRETVTLPGALRSVDYDTCLTGKWHLGSLPEQGPNHFGFQHSYGSLAGGVTPYSHRYKLGPFTHTWHRNEQLLEEPGHVTDLIAEEAVTWIGARGKRPFFLYVPFTAVHLPIKEPAQWIEAVPTEITGEVARHYAACVMHLDDSVGRILAALEQAGKLKNTLVIFTSDNGGSRAENNDAKYPSDNCPSGTLPGSNRPFRGQKGQLYEGGVRVPTIVSWPGVIPVGQSDTPVQIIDWMPTLCAIAGYTAAVDLQWDGIDLSQWLIRREMLAPRPLYAVAPGWRSRSLRHGDWKLIVGDRKSSPPELYNLRDDPEERTNRAIDEPKRVEELHAMLESMAVRDREAVAK